MQADLCVNFMWNKVFYECCDLYNTLLAAYLISYLTFTDAKQPFPILTTTTIVKDLRILSI